ncbi:hypothetical protein GCM10009721_11920 [Terrabacter tumescens]|uniref:ERCC4 domain-containing protein n=1 Tax=Terrabacter tumescens TaxID=60443 RepID=A0ABQ2HR73_9MICO|nr:ERCC4 domain-containing protein [Terrabacter tumescens]GGM88475.1 hypothetical protein GCM10009721_11920 [Terrabacter tumescens]
MPDDFLIARNPDEASTLPYLVRIPLGEHGIVLKSKDTWPRTSKVYCHRADGWPDDADVVVRVPTRVCVRRGAAIELVLDRGRESRSQFVLTHVKGREAIFWQSARTAKQARPAVRIPTARAAGAAGAAGAPGEADAAGPLEIVVDAHERYAWRFSQQQVSTRKQRLDAGDYAVEADGQVVAAVERKSLEDLTSSLLNGKLRYALAELSGLPRAAVVVEERYSRVFALTHVRPAVVADAIAECQARYPAVPIVFAETRALAQEWTYRFLAAALRETAAEAHAESRMAGLAPAGPVSEPAPSTAVVRAWALAEGLAVSDRGRLRPEIWDAYRAAH